MGELEQARDYHQRAMEITKNVLGPDHIEVATWYNNLGVVHQAVGELFCYSNGTHLSRSQFTKELRALLAQGAGINIADYAGHSFRIGAA